MQSVPQAPLTDALSPLGTPLQSSPEPDVIEGEKQVLEALVEKSPK